MVRGNGSWLWDEAGNRYLDFLQGWAVNALGHCAPELVSALESQAAKLLTPSPAFHNMPQLQLAATLCQLTGLDQAVFCNSGAEANEVALKLARKFGAERLGGAHHVVATHGGFHGRTLATMALSGKPAFHALFHPLMPGFAHVPFGDARAVAQALTDDTVAVMVEPIQGEAGVVVPPAGYLRELRQITRKAGKLLILDEVQTGIGRTGHLFAFQAEDVLPDILTLGKGLGAGFPLSATLVTKDANCLAPGDHGGTYGGSPLACAAGLAVTQTVTAPGFMDSVRERGAYLRERLVEVGAPVGATVRGQGLLWALVLPRPIASAVATSCFGKGLLVNAAQPTVLRFAPSLRVSQEEIDAMATLLRQALQELRE